MKCLMNFVPVRERPKDGIEPVNWDYNHDEAREIESNDPDEDHDTAGDVIRLPGHGVGPGYLQWHLEHDHLKW